MKRKLAIAILIIAVLGGTAAAQKLAKKSVPPLSQIRRWTRVNPKPLLLPPALNAYCRPISRIETVENPHRDKYFTVYVNKPGAEAMMAEKPSNFPRGTAIVKEKLPGPKARNPELLTAMVKREKGYDPSGGDWEYVALDGSGQTVLESGKLPHCKSCHTTQRASHYTFRTYVPRKVPGAGSYRP